VNLNCDQLESLLPEFFDGTLPAALADAAGDHLATCTSCTATVSELGQVRDLVHDRAALQLDQQARTRIRESLQ
jgi:anti-sigma factor RsiW